MKSLLLVFLLIIFVGCEQTDQDKYTNSCQCNDLKLSFISAYDKIIVNRAPGPITISALKCSRDKNQTGTITEICNMRSENSELLLEEQSISVDTLVSMLTEYSIEEIPLFN
jgi:hypothetical protein